MVIINKVISLELGEIVCIGNDKNEPIAWGKKEKIKLFSEEEKEIWVYFDLYCFDKEFSYSEYWNDKAMEVEHKIAEMYNILKNDICKIEERFLVVFNEMKDELNIDDDINSKEELYSKVSVKEIRIHCDSYSIIVHTVWDELEDYGYQMNFFDEEESYDSLNIESEIEPVEMEY